MLPILTIRPFSQYAGGGSADINMPALVGVVMLLAIVAVCVWFVIGYLIGKDQ